MPKVEPIELKCRVVFGSADVIQDGDAVKVLPFAVNLYYLYQTLTGFY